MALRTFLKAYAFAIATFLPLGMLVMTLYFALYDNSHNPWGAEAPQPIAFVLLFGVLGFLAYLPILVVMGGTPMFVACAVYMLVASVAGGPRPPRVAALVAGLAAGGVAAAATRWPAARLYTAHWWSTYAFGCVLAGGIAAVAQVALMRAFRVAPAVAVAGTRRFSPIALLIALALCGLAWFAASQADHEDEHAVMLRRGAEAAAEAFRASPPLAQANALLAFMATPGATASFVERAANGDMVHKPIGDAAQLAASMTALRPPPGTAPVVHHLGAVSFELHPGSRYDVSFREAFGQRESKETLQYDMQGESVRLLMYSLTLEGNARDPVNASLYIHR